MEWWTFKIGSFFAGVVEVEQLGVQATIYELAVMVYLVCHGFGVVANVWVGNALWAGNAGQALCSCLTVFLCVSVCPLEGDTLLSALKNVLFSYSPEISFPL